MISANFYEALTGMNISDQGAAVEFIAQWSPAVKKIVVIKTELF